MDYYITRNNETNHQKMVVIFNDGRVRNVEHNHPQYAAIKEILDTDRTREDEVRTLIDSLEQNLNNRMVELTERISVANGHLVVDGDIVNNALSDHIMHMLDNGDDDYLRVVKFYENLLQNPSEQSRDQLFDWLTAVGMFSLDENGCVLGYKGVTHNNTSRQSGRAYVQGELVRGRIPYEVGTVVTMPRSEVEDDPTVACAPGLHVGTFEYAQGWGDKVKLVVFNPRDAVSVPSRETAKLRVCRLGVLDDSLIPHDQTTFVGRRFYDEEKYYDDDDFEDYED